MTERSPENSLTSLQNPLVQRLRELHRATGRREFRQFLVEGRRAISAFLEAGLRPDHLLVRVGEDIPPEWSTQIIITRMSARVAERLSQATTPSGYLAQFPLPEPPSLDAGRGGLVLARIADPGNVGTLIRSAVAFGIEQIVLIGSADAYAHKVVQATAGALVRARIFEFGDEVALTPIMGGSARCALVVSGGTPPTALPPRPRWLIVGSEAHGIPDAWLENCDERVSLPMPGGTESLNAAVAGSIACYLLMK
jgi:TrmH family RNA methyltransferase